MSRSPRGLYTFKCQFKRYVANPFFQVDLLICNQYGTLQFGKFEEIRQKGYLAALECLQQFKAEGKLPPGVLPGTDEKTPERRKGKSARRNSI